MPVKEAVTVLVDVTSTWSNLDDFEASVETTDSKPTQVKTWSLHAKIFDDSSDESDRDLSHQLDKLRKELQAKELVWNQKELEIQGTIDLQGEPLLRKPQSSSTWKANWPLKMDSYPTSLLVQPIWKPL